MIKIIISLILFLQLFQTASAQPYTLWMRNYGDNLFQEFESLWPTSDGGIIAVGRTVEGEVINNMDVWVVRTDAWGDTLWTREIGDIWDQFDSGSAIQETSDKGFIITGHISFPWGDIDVWLIKLDSLGNKLWDKDIGEEAAGWFHGPGIESGIALDITLDGGFIISAFSQDSNGVDNVLVIKTDSVGDTLWTRMLGGERDDWIDSIKETLDGGYILTGNSWSFNDDSLRALDLWLVYLDGSGNILWMKTYDFIGHELGRTVIEISEGGFIIGGMTSARVNGINSDAWLLKTDANGDTLWTRTYGGINNEQAYSILQSKDGGYVFAGFTDSSPLSFDNADVWIVKTDSNGDTLWTKTAGDTLSDLGFEVIKLEDGYVVAGLSYKKNEVITDLAEQHIEGLLIRFGDALSRLAVSSVEGTIENIISVPVRITFPLELTFTAVHLEVSGYQNSLNFIGLDTFNTVIGSAGWQDSVVETSEGITIDVYGDNPITADDTLFTLMFSAEEYISEFIEIRVDSAIIDSGEVPVEIKNGGVQLVPITAVDEETKSLPKRYSLSQNYPNPFNPMTNISYYLPIDSKVSLVVYNLRGQKVTQLVDSNEPAGNYKVTWDASNVSSGLYFYRLQASPISVWQAGDYIKTRKMLLLK